VHSHIHTIPHTTSDPHYKDSYLTIMFVQSRIIHGVETRLQPARQERDFRKLVEYEQRHAQLVQEFTTRVTPSLAAELKRNPEVIRNYPHLISDHEDIAYVRAFKFYPESKYLRYPLFADSTNHR
jgi:hypothetical protein